MFLGDLTLSSGSEVSHNTAHRAGGVSVTKGNATLMTVELMETLVDHSAGNDRSLMIMGGQLLAQSA